MFALYKWQYHKSPHAERFEQLTELYEWHMEQQLTLDKNELRAKSKNYIQPLMKKITMVKDTEKKMYADLMEERVEERENNRRLLTFEEMYEVKKTE
jgi:hypothetical protein